jgi:hypothetical protein
MRAGERERRRARLTWLRSMSSSSNVRGIRSAKFFKFSKTCEMLKFQVPSLQVPASETTKSLIPSSVLGCVCKDAVADVWSVGTACDVSSCVGSARGQSVGPRVSHAG